MEMNKIVELAEKGQISKWACWSLIRERFLVLKECQELLMDMPDCVGVHITRDGVVYEARGGGKLFFDFEEVPLSRAESMLCGTEREDWDFIEALIPENGVVLDIGANVGWFSIRLAKKRPCARIYALEPVTETYEKMKRNLNMNGLLAMSSQGGRYSLSMKGFMMKMERGLFMCPHHQRQLLCNQ